MPVIVPAAGNLAKTLSANGPPVPGRSVPFALAGLRDGSYGGAPVSTPHRAETVKRGTT